MELENRTAKNTEAAVISVRRLLRHIFLQASVNIFFILFDALHILNREETIFVLLVEFKIQILDNRFVFLIICWSYC